LEAKNIQAIHLADGGIHDKRNYIKTYKITYTQNGIDWKDYNSGQILQGRKKLDLKPFQAKVVRINPQTWNGMICGRFELYFSNKA
tara:strand:+ start:138 stop:395 length:258 start_codon:yes stop_codon:yes gene_type:complete